MANTTLLLPGQTAVNPMANALQNMRTQNALMSVPSTAVSGPGVVNPNLVQTGGPAVAPQSPVTPATPAVAPPVVPQNPVTPATPAVAPPVVPQNPVTPTSPLPQIPQLPPVYSGPGADTFTSQINSLQSQITPLQGEVDFWNSFKGSYGLNQGQQTQLDNYQSQLDQLNSQMNDLQTQKLDATQGAAANTTQQTILGAIPGLEQSLSTNLSDQTTYALQQIQPIIEQRLNALGILNSGALPATEETVAGQLAQQAQGSLSDFVMNAATTAGTGLPLNMLQGTLANLASSTNETFAQTNAAQALQNQEGMLNSEITSAQNTQLPFWQQMLLGLSSGAGIAGGAVAAKHLF